MKPQPTNAKLLLINIAGMMNQDFILIMIMLPRKQKESLTLAAAYPLFFEIASKEQAAGVAKILQEKFVYCRWLNFYN